MKTIVVTGPESTGKTMISEFLSRHLECPWVPEYAREYIGKLNRPYTYIDLEYIMDMQIRQKIEMEKAGTSFLVLDTWLILTKVWFFEVFKQYPVQLDEEISKHKIDLFVICKPDMPWIPDPLRENGGARRDYLMNRYVEEIKSTCMDYIIIGGSGDDRYHNALQVVKTHFSLPL